MVLNMVQEYGGAIAASTGSHYELYPYLFVTSETGNTI